MPQAVYRQEGAALDYTPTSAVAAGDVLVLGTNLIAIAKLDIPANKLGAAHVVGVFDVVKDDSDIAAWTAAYWDADGNPVGGDAGTGAFSDNSTLGPFAGWFLEAAGTTVGTVRMLLTSLVDQDAVARSELVQDDEQFYTIPIEAYRIHDNLHQLAPGVGANDDLGLVTGTYGTSAPTLQTGDSKAATTSRKTRFQFAVPPEYVAGEDITLRINAGMLTTIADTSADLDVQCVRTAAPTVDLCATAAQDINAIDADDYDFTITPTDVVPGDVLDFVLTIDIVDGSTATAVIGKINSVEVLLAIKG
jgi:predicted RecA/RadA family phage recombinase